MMASGRECLLDDGFGGIDVLRIVGNNGSLRWRFWVLLSALSCNLFHFGLPSCRQDDYWESGWCGWVQRDRHPEVPLAALNVSDFADIIEKHLVGVEINNSILVLLRRQQISKYFKKRAERIEILDRQLGFFVHGALVFQQLFDLLSIRLQPDI